MGGPHGESLNPWDSQGFKNFWSNFLNLPMGSSGSGTRRWGRFHQRRTREQSFRDASGPPDRKGRGCGGSVLAADRINVRLPGRFPNSGPEAMGLHNPGPADHD